MGGNDAANGGLRPQPIAGVRGPAASVLQSLRRLEPDYTGFILQCKNIANATNALRLALLGILSFCSSLGSQSAAWGSSCRLGQPEGTEGVESF